MVKNRLFFLILTITFSRMNYATKTDKCLFQRVESLSLDHSDKDRIRIFKEQLKYGYKTRIPFLNEAYVITKTEMSLTRELISYIAEGNSDQRHIDYLKILIAYRHENKILLSGDEVSPNLLKQLALSLTPENNNPSDDIVKLLYDIQTLASTDSHNCALNKAVKEAGADRCSEKLLDLPGFMFEDTDRIKSKCMEQIRKNSQN